MDILQIEQKRLDAVHALMCLQKCVNDSDFVSLIDEVKEAIYAVGHSDSCKCLYHQAVLKAKTHQAEGNAPFDSFEPEPKYLTEEFRPLRFICKACGLWNEELEAPNLLPNSFTEKDTFNAVPLIAPYLNKYRDALTPGLFIRFFREVSDAQIRPQIILDRWNEFLQWCKNKGYIA